MIKQYLSTLHTRPDHHKRRFALFVSSSVTLLIFGVWANVHFGQSSVVASAPAVQQSTSAVSPFDTIKASVSEGWSRIAGTLTSAKAGLDSVDMQDTYTQVRNNALSQTPARDLNNYYGQ